MNKKRGDISSLLLSDGGEKMGQLVDGVWQDVWYDTKSTGGRFSALFRPSVTGSPPMARPAQLAKAALRPKKTVILLCFTRLSVGAPHADCA
jgi:hypothetical protein